MIKGMPQVVEHASSATRLSYIVKDDTGREIAPDAVPTITIYEPPQVWIQAITDDTGGTEYVIPTYVSVEEVAINSNGFP